MNNNNNSVFFLAGPIRGAGNWRNDAIRLLSNSKVNIVSPDNEVNKTSGNVITQSNCSRLDFERKYLLEASVNGCIIFWLPAESKTNPRKDGQYARDTRFELGEWITRHRLQNANVIIGMENEFPGASVIRKNVAAIAPDLHIYNKLEDMIANLINKP